MNDCLSDQGDTLAAAAKPLWSLQLVPLSPAQIPILMSWFDNQEALRRWSPGTTFPPELHRFIRETRLNLLCNRALVDAQGMMVGFGQYSDREGYCHLSRLVIAPHLRGQCLGSRLIALLADEGTKALGLERLSLFVNHDNAAALRLYLRLGFVATPFHDPDALRHAQAQYLTRPFLQG
jgi:ribosomal protein S18 acetylase RimI-like enzyme